MSVISTLSPWCYLSDSFVFLSKTNKPNKNNLSIQSKEAIFFSFFCIVKFELLSAIFK